jgi:hypothetical protein
MIEIATENLVDTAAASLTIASAEASSSLWRTSRQLAEVVCTLLHHTHVASPPSLLLFLQFHPSPYSAAFT